MPRANLQVETFKLIFNKAFAKELTNTKQFLKFGMDVKVDPKNSNGEVRFVRYPLFAPATTPLTEGTPPTPDTLTAQTVSCIPQQYGSYLKLTDRDKIFEFVDNNARGLEVLSEQAGHTLNVLTRNVLDSNTNILYSGTAAALADVESPITKDDLDRVIKTLRRNNVDPVSEFVDGSKNFNTTPIDDSYIAIIHPDVAKDIENLAGFTPVAQYGQRVKMVGEIGEINRIRFVVDTDCNIEVGAGSTSITGVENNGTNVNVYTSYIIGKDAYGRVSFKNNIETIIKPLGSAGSSDPLNQISTIGWKTYYGAVIMYPEKALLLKSAASL